MGQWLETYECPGCQWQQEIFIPASLGLSEIPQAVEDYCEGCGDKYWMRHLAGAPAAHDYGNCSNGVWLKHVGHHGKHYRDKKSMKEDLKRQGLREMDSYG